MELSTIFQVLVGACCFYFAKQYYDIWKAKRDLPGPSFVWPIFGSVFQMVMHPYKFYEKQKQYGPISWNAIVGRLFIYTRDPEITKKVFANREGNLRLWLYMNAEKILGENNIAFMHGNPHKTLRKELIHLFTKKALSKYLAIQEKEIRKHVQQWLKTDIVQTPKEVRVLVRNLNVETSIHVFTGNYMDDQTRERFKTDYLLMNEGLLAFPLNFPGTKLYRAIQARKRIIETLITIIERSQEKMNKPESVSECLVDEWMKIVVQKSTDKRETSVDYAFHILDFLFASQDASTSSLIWVFELLSKHPDVWNLIKQEQDSVRPEDDPLTLEILEKLENTNRFVKELLRWSAPAVSVPHIAVEDFKLSETFTVPKGTVLFPSITWAHTTNEGYKDWENFDIHRWTPERREESAKNFLAFGHGAHKCLGQEYAQNHLKAFTSIVVKNLNWKRIFTEKSDQLEFFPTVIPADGCILQLVC